MNSSMFMRHINVRSLQQNVDTLFNFIASLSLQPDVIAISEIKLKKHEYTVILISLDMNSFILTVLQPLEVEDYTLKKLCV